MKKLAKRVRDFILNIFFPTVCPYCGKVIYPDEYACAECIKKLPPKSITKYAVGGYLCSAPLPYEGAYSNAVKTFKFGSMGSYAGQLAFLIVQSVLEVHKNIDFDFITCVPMHIKDKKKRRYNQAELLARECAEIMNLPYIEAIEKFKQNQAQHTLSGIDRERNVKGVFRVIEEDKVRDKSVLIVDDIITTGNTLGECCRILKKSGAKNIYCAALCSVR